MRRQALELLRELCPAVTVDAEAQVVDEGKVMTSAGIAAGIDLALLIVRRIHGEAVARATARHMEYPFPEGCGRRVARGSVAVTFEDGPKDKHD